MKRFTESHEWVEESSDGATVGITEHAVQEIGEVVHVELPQVGTKLKAADVACVIESTKAAIDIASPVSGEVVAINASLIQHIEKINSSSESNGWLFKIRLQDKKELDALMDQAAYSKMILS